MAVELATACAEKEMPVTIQIDFTEKGSGEPELFLAAMGDMADYIAMTAEHLVVQAEAQAERLDRPVDAVVATMISALTVCAEVSKGSETISTDPDEITGHLSLSDVDKETMN